MMGPNFGIFILGLLLGAYLTASYPDEVIHGLKQVHIPLLGHHMPVTSR